MTVIWQYINVWTSLLLFRFLIWWLVNFLSKATKIILWHTEDVQKQNSNLYKMTENIAWLCSVASCIWWSVKTKTTNMYKFAKSNTHVCIPLLYKVWLLNWCTPDLTSCTIQCQCTVNAHQPHGTRKPWLVLRILTLSGLSGVQAMQFSKPEGFGPSC